MKALSAEQTVASGAWKGGLMLDIMLGVKTRTFGVLGCAGFFFSGGVRRDVRSGRNDWMVRIGCRRCVLKRSAKLEGGIVAIGLVW